MLWQNPQPKRTTLSHGPPPDAAQHTQRITLGPLLTASDVALSYG